MAQGTVLPALEADEAAGTAATPWLALDTSAEGEFLYSWLARQCAAVPGARAGIIVVKGAAQPVGWPKARDGIPQLASVAERALRTERPVIAWSRRSDGTPGANLVLGLRVAVSPSPLAIAMVVELRGVETADTDAIAAQIRLGAGWLEARGLVQRTTQASARLHRASVAMEIVALAGAQRRAREAAYAVVNELALRMRCDRVSLGQVRRGRIRLAAMSHVSAVQRRGRVIETIEDAMEECLAQAAPIAYPRPLEVKGGINVAHRELAALGRAPGHCASVLLPGRDRAAGVLTFERCGGEPFDTEHLLVAEAIGTLLGPIHDAQIANNRWFAGRIVDAAQDGLAAVLGRDRPSLKLAAAAAVAVIATVCLLRTEYRVTAKANLEGEVQRAAVAPFDGFITTSPVRPGDRVHAGDLLAAMDDRELVLERTRAWADLEKLRQKYSEAMAKHDRPASAAFAAQIEQSQAQLDLADDKLSRARIVASIDGLIVSGDLSQTLGAPVERGKTLFEVAPLDRYRVLLRTDERDLRYVALGQHGTLALAGMPGERRAFTVTRITPVSEAKDGRNEFRVEATLDDAPGPELRPGMEGVGKIESGQRPLLWIWSHGLIDWARLLVWKWLP